MKETDSYTVQAVLTLKDNMSAGFKNAAASASAFGGKIKSAIGLGAAMQVGMKGVSVAMGALSSHMDSAISRVDTMRNFPKVMGQMGFSTKKADASINKMSEAIDGLPTSLDSITSSAQNIALMTGDLDKATDTAIALNNAFLSGGKGTADAARGLEQYTQMMSVGKVDMQAWKTVCETMGPAINKVAKAFGYAGKSAKWDLYEALQDGEITFDELNDKMIELNDGTNGFAESAKVASAGIKTSFTNIGTAVTKGLADCILAVDEMLKKNKLPTIVQLADKVKVKIGKAFKGAAKAIKSINLEGIISGLTPAFQTLGMAAKWAGKIISAVAKFLNKHAEGISSWIPLIIGGALAFKAYKKVSSWFVPISGATEKINALGNSSKKTRKATLTLKRGLASLAKNAGIALIIGSLALLAKSLEGIAKCGGSAVAPLLGFAAAVSAIALVLSETGKKLQKNMKGIIAFSAGVAGMALAMTPLANTGLEGAAAMGAFGAVVSGIAMVLSKTSKQLQKNMKGIIAFSAGVAGMALAMAPLASTGAEGIAAMGAFGLVVAGLAVVLAGLGTKLQTGKTGIIVFSAAVSAMALAMGPIAQSGTEGAIAMGAFGVVVAGLVAVFAIFGTALEVAIPGMIAFGATVLMIGAGMYLAAPAITALVQLIRQVGDTFSQVAGAIASAVSQIVTVIGSTLCGIMQTAADVINQVADSISGAFLRICDGVVEVIDAISGGLTSVLDSIAGIIDSVGTSAKNAGEGFKSVAEGIQILSQMSFGDILKSLGSVALGIGGIATKGKRMSEVASGMQTLMTAITLGSGSITMFNAAMTAMSAQVSSISTKAAALKESFSNFVITPPNIGPFVAAFTQITASAQMIVPSLTAAGQRAGSGLASGLSSGASNAAAMISAVSAAVIATITSLAARLISSGKSAGTGFANGLKAGYSTATSTTARTASQIVSRLRSARSGAYSAGAYIGQGLASGINSQVGSVRAAAARLAEAADEAIRAKAQINSPSRVTQKSGKYIAQGLGRGIAKNTKYVVNASVKLANSAFKTLKKANGNYEKLGKSLVKKYKSGMESKRDKAIESTKNLITATVNKMKRRNSGAASSYSKAGSALTKAFTTAIKSGAKKAIAATESAINSISKKYQNLYDKAIEARTAFKSSLSDVGSLYTVDDYGFMSLKNFKAGTSQINAYAKNLNKLKKVLPKGLMDEILQLDTASGLAYTKQLLKMSTSELKAYGKTYTAYQSAASKTATNYYKSELASIKNNFSKAVTAELKKLTKKLKSIGKDAMQGFISGMNSKKKTLDSAGKALANSVLKQFKKTLKIHSPSRALMKVGKYTGEGYVNGLLSMMREIQTVTADMISIPSAATMPELSFAGAPSGSVNMAEEYEYYRNAQYTIIVPVEVDGREMAKVTAPYTQDELDRMQRRNNRKRGNR